MEKHAKKRIRRKKRNKMKKKTHWNSAKFWSKKMRKKGEQIEKRNRKYEKMKKANTGERKRKKTKVDQKTCLILRVFFDGGIRFVELEPNLFFGKKGVAKKWKKKTKWKLKQRNDWKCVLWWFVVHEIDNTLLLVCFSVHFQSKRVQNKMFCIVFRCRFAIAIVLWRFPAKQLQKNMRFVIFVFFWWGRRQGPLRTPRTGCNLLLLLLSGRSSCACWNRVHLRPADLCFSFKLWCWNISPKIQPILRVSCFKTLSLRISWNREGITREAWKQQQRKVKDSRVGVPKRPCREERVEEVTIPFPGVFGVVLPPFLLPPPKKNTDGVYARNHIFECLIQKKNLDSLTLSVIVYNQKSRQATITYKVFKTCHNLSRFLITYHT